MLVLPENVPNDFESALPGSLGQIDPGAGKKTYLFPGSKMRMLGSSGRRWTRKVRAGVKPSISTHFWPLSRLSNNCC